MLSARTFNLLANVSLAAGVAALAISISLELTKWTRGEAREVVRYVPVREPDMRDYTDETAPEKMPVRLAMAGEISGAERYLKVSASTPQANQQINQLETTASISANAIAGAARAPAAPKEAKLAALPAKAGIIFEELGRKVCLGGTLCVEHCRVETDGCTVQPAYAIKLERPAFISAIQLYAHDQIGPTRRASLLVKVNGEAVGKTEVYRFGSTLTVKVGRVGQLVTVESMHAVHGFQSGGEEAVIWDVYLLGREPR